MKRTTSLLCLLALLLLLPLSSCGLLFGDDNDDINLSPEELRQRVTSHTGELVLDINEENIEDASFFVSNLFTMEPGVASRFEVGNFTGMGKAAFRNFFEAVSDKYGNIVLSIQINSIQVQGDVATAFVTVTFNGEDVDAAPPINVSFTAQHVMVWEIEGDSVLLVNWGVPGGGHNQGGGQNF